MSKTIYITLLLITIGILGYTGFYIATYQAPTPIITEMPTATTTPEVAEVPSKKTILTTKSGKSIIIEETNPNGESLSTIVITPKDFVTNETIILEENKLTATYLLDMNQDTFDELVLVTIAQGSGSYGQVDIFTTAGDKNVSKVTVPEITEDDAKKGGLFEGYMGHDTFSITNGVLVREFPTYTATNTNSTPTGPVKKLLYTLSMKDGIYSVALKKESATSSSTPKTATSLQGVASTSVQVR